MFTDIPDVHFGNASSEKVDWRQALIDDTPDDDELHETPAEVTQILGFDPVEIDEPLEKTSRFCCDDGGMYRHFTEEDEKKCTSDVKDALDSMKEQVLEQLPHLLDLGKMEKADDNGNNNNQDENAVDNAVNAADLSAAKRLLIVQSHTSRIAITAARKAAQSTKQYMNQDTFDQVDDNAVAYAKKRGAELVTEVSDATRGRLRKLMTSAVKNGMSASELRDAVSDDFAFSNQRALMIARTEMAFASSGGAMTGYDTARTKFGLKMQKTWLLGDNACEICEENAAQGPIPFEDAFQSGDDAPPAHPNCRCDIAAEVIP